MYCFSRSLAADITELQFLALVPSTSTLLCCLGAGDDLGTNMNGIGGALGDRRPEMESLVKSLIGVGVVKTLSTGAPFTRLAVDGVPFLFGSWLPICS